MKLSLGKKMGGAGSLSPSSGWLSWMAMGTSWLDPFT